MAWTTEEWKQDDAVFYGYPIPVSVSAPEVIRKSLLPSKWSFDNAFYGYPHVVKQLDNPINIMYGQIPVQKVYLGTELIWKRGGINKIMTGNLVIINETG